jgi:hypothetical protein
MHQGLKQLWRRYYRRISRRKRPANRTALLESLEARLVLNGAPPFEPGWWGLDTPLPLLDLTFGEGEGPSGNDNGGPSSSGNSALDRPRTSDSRRVSAQPAGCRPTLCAR